MQLKAKGSFPIILSTTEQTERGKEECRNIFFLHLYDVSSLALIYLFQHSMWRYSIWYPVVHMNKRKRKNNCDYHFNLCGEWDAPHSSVCCNIFSHTIIMYNYLLYYNYKLHHINHKLLNLLMYVYGICIYVMCVV